MRGTRDVPLEHSCPICSSLHISLCLAARTVVEEAAPVSGQAAQQALPEEPLPEPPGVFAAIGAMGAGGERW